MSEGISLQSAAEFVWAEGELLDRQAYRPWLGLWTEGGRYIIPIERGEADPADALNIVFDDAEMREARIRRLLSGVSLSSDPPARTVRTISRFVIKQSQERTLDLCCAQMLVEYKYERTRILAADVEYRLVRFGDELRMERKVVRLINSDDALFGIGYLL